MPDTSDYALFKIRKFRVHKTQSNVAQRLLCFINNNIIRLDQIRVHCVWNARYIGKNAGISGKNKKERMKIKQATSPESLTTTKSKSATSPLKAHARNKNSNNINNNMLHYK